MSEIVTKITHQVMVPIGMRPSEAFASTGRVIYFYGGTTSSIPEFTFGASHNITYLHKPHDSHADKALLLCEENGLVPAHPALVALDCIARPSFTDLYESYTFWGVEDKFYYAFFGKAGRSRAITLCDERGLSSYLHPKDLWLATVPK